MDAGSEAATVRPPDCEQREFIARELDVNILVEAAAGTGKTTSMVERMLALLRTGKCENIRTMAAVTFTRKAAAELRSRFQMALEKAVRAAGGEEKERLEAALINVEQCFIGTIHSFCARLLRERPVEAGVGLSFVEIDEEEDERLKEEAWEAFAAGLIADDPHGFARELDYLGLRVSDLRSAFKSFADYPDVEEWPVPGKAEPETAHAQSELSTYLDHMSELGPRLDFDYGTDTLVPRLLRMPRIVSHYEDLDRIDQLMEVLEMFDSNAEIRVTFWQQRGGFTREEAQGELERWNRFREEVAKPGLKAWRELRYATVLPVLTAARDIYDGIRRERGQLNFQDLLMKAAALLRETPSVRRYFQSRFTHLLVDEFQDTDPIQAEVILLLCSSDPEEPDWRGCSPRPGSLFLVGDPKQSIYRFRRADIVTYNETKKILLAGGGLVVNLSANFRAAPPVISWVNEVFGPSGPEYDDQGKAMLRFPECDTEESPCYVPLLPGREEGAVGGLCGLYRLRIPEEFTNKGAAMEYEADLIARFIRGALDGGITVPRSHKQLVEGKGPQASPDDFLIVTYKKGDLSVYARALQVYGIPHRVTGGLTLNELEELRLLHTCLRAVVHPDDPVALVGALRSELFGFSDQVLYAFRRAGGSFSYNAPLPAALGAEHAGTFSDAFSRMARYSLWLSRFPHAAACGKIAADLGLPALAAARPGGDMQAGSLGKALELLRGIQDEVWSAAQLTEYLGKLVEREEEYDGVSALSGAHPSVQVMNLHKVKGLEAPVVFLASPSLKYEHAVKKHIDRSGNRTRGFLAVHGEGTEFQDGDLLAHPADWDSLAESEMLFEKAEELRLRYVAATRAGAATIITRRASGSDLSPWRHFEPFLTGDCDLPDPGPQSPPEISRSPLTPQEVARAGTDMRSRLEAAGAATYGVHPLKQYALSLGGGGTFESIEQAGENVSVTPPGEHGVEWGEVIHLLLQEAMSGPRDELDTLAAAALAEAGLSTSLAPQAAELVRSVTSSEIWERASRSDTRFVEVPLQALWDDGFDVPTVLRGAIDLVFREGGGWVLVDYKTDRPGAGGLERLADRYAPQIRLYAEAWEKCSGEPVMEAFLYFTSTGELAKIST